MIKVMGLIKEKKFIDADNSVVITSGKRDGGGQKRLKGVNGDGRDIIF